MSKVLFVCLGNICRSPLAEAIFVHMCKLKGITKISSDSAGTGAYHIGEQPDPRTIQVAQENEIHIYHKARKFKIQDCEDFDYIFAMDEANYQNIVAIVGHKPEQLYLLREFDPDTSQEGDLNVPDPYYGSLKDFRSIFYMMSESLENFIETKLR